MEKRLKVYTCNDHNTHWVGVATVVVAKDKRQAKRLIDKELVAIGLKPYKESPYTIKELSTDTPIAIVLQNGGY